MTRNSSVPLAQVDDWIDHLVVSGYSWQSMSELLQASKDHLVDLRRDELALGSSDKAARLRALANDFGELLNRLSTVALAPDPAVVTIASNVPASAAPLDLKISPRRGPDLQSSRERIELVETLYRELAIVKQEAQTYTTVAARKQNIHNLSCGR